MRLALLFVIACTALLVSACSPGAPRARLDGPLTVITVAAAERGVVTLGVPFVDGEAVVENVAVRVAVVDSLNLGAVASGGVASSNGPSTTELRFTFEDGLYSYDPDGLITAIEFPFDGSVSVALPAGDDYVFESTGTDVDDLWIVYGTTHVQVSFATSNVLLALQTLIDFVTLDTVAPLAAVVPGERVDVFLQVFAPGGYAVPMADYSANYVLAVGDGAISASSDVGARVVANIDPGDDAFTLDVTVFGLRDVGGGVAAWSSVEASFERPFAISAGLGFDGTAPNVAIDPVTSATVGSPVALAGTATDEVAVARVQVFEGPQMIGSTDPNDQNQYGAAVVSLGGGEWSLSWTPERVGSYTLTVVAFDASGNEGQSSTVIEVEPLVLQELTFVEGVPVFATVAAGESVVLQGTAASGFEAGEVALSIFSLATTSNATISTAGLVVADGMWTLAWTAPAVLGPYDVNYRYNGMPNAQAYIGLSVQ